MRLLDDLTAYLRFATGLRAFLSDPFDSASIDSVVSRLHQTRVERLLHVSKRCIFDYPASPYLKLLQSAGCTFGDLEMLLKKEGVENSLRRLARGGVYVTTEEFKGRKAAIRGSSSFFFAARDFENPISTGHLVGATGGSRSPGTRTVYDFKNIAENWTSHIVFRLRTYGLFSSPVCIWYPPMPGAGPLVVLAMAKAGTFVKWFSPLPNEGFLRNLRSHLGTSYVMRMGRLLDNRFPALQYVPYSDPEPIVDWIRSQLLSAGKCTIMTYVSAAVRISQAANAMGTELPGATFSVTSEPITPAKRAEIESAGGRVIPSFATMEAGSIAAGCMNSSYCDDMHLLDDTVALTQHKRVVQESPQVEAFLITGILDSFPKVLFNTETGDFGQLRVKDCGCPFQAKGFKTHIWDVYGFDKLSASGMSFVGSDLVRILEEILPARFGGTCMDYQFVEEEDASGQTRMTVIVDTKVGAVEEERVVATILTELSRGSEANRLMAKTWSESGTLRVKKAKPSVTIRGKLLPLHLTTRKKP